MTTLAYVPHPIAACLLSAEDIIGEGRIWDTPNATKETEMFLRSLPQTIEDLNRLTEYMKTCTSFDVDVINEFFERNGFPDIKLESLEPNQFASGAILEIILKWITEGYPDELIIKENDQYIRYPSAVLEGGGTQYVSSDGSEIARIDTSNGFSVFLSSAYGETFATDFDVLCAILKRNASMEEAGVWRDIEFPMVKIDYTHDLGWIIGLSTTTQAGQPCRLIKADQKTQFAMNHKGASVKSAARVVCALESCGPPRRDFIFDKPFLLWITQEGSNVPIMFAFVDKDSWKDPEA